MKTTQRSPLTRARQWYVVDADGQVLGRLAARISTVLMGKHKPDYTPHVDVGDFVVVTNARKIALSGLKRTQKLYDRASGYHGGLKQIPLERMLERMPDRVIRLAVKRMLPKNFVLARHMLKKLRVYAGAAHPHEAQKPQPFPWLPKVRTKAS